MVDTMVKIGLIVENCGDGSVAIRPVATFKLARKITNFLSGNDPHWEGSTESTEELTIETSPSLLINGKPPISSLEEYLTKYYDKKWNKEIWKKFNLYRDQF